jgi:hypothetical protein
MRRSTNLFLPISVRHAAPNSGCSSALQRKCGSNAHCYEVFEKASIGTMVFYPKQLNACLLSFAKRNLAPRSHAAT